ncbi:MAG: hypothetical protein MK345_07030 [SAR202 cluster bacterium]|nr:hypothetical protein [SAR202 cluster bacterium]
MKILSSSFLIILSTLFLIGCNAVTGQATGVSEQDQIDEAVMYIEGKSNACSNEFYSGPMKDFEFKFNLNKNQVRDWLNDCMSNYGTSGNWMPSMTYSIFGTIVDDVNLNFSYGKADIDSTIAYLEEFSEDTISEKTQSFSNPNNQTDQDILFANNYLDTATDECINEFEIEFPLVMGTSDNAIKNWLNECSTDKPIFGTWHVHQSGSVFFPNWDIQMTHSPEDIQDTIIYLSVPGEKQNDEPVLTKSYEVAANEVSNDDNQQQQENSGWDYERQNYTVDEQAALDACIQEIADFPDWVKVVYSDGTHPMQNYFNSCVSDNGFGNLNFDLNDVEGLFIGASPANALNNEPEVNNFTDEQIATVVENCENEMQGLAFPQYMLRDGRTPAQAYFESCLEDEGISVDIYNDWVEAQEPEPVIMDGPPQGEALENVLSICVNEAYSSSIAIRFRSANAAEEYLQTSFNDCLNSLTVFEEYSYSEYSYLLNQTPDEPDNNQEESIEDRVDDLEQKFADLFEQLQEILESVEN